MTKEKGIATNRPGVSVVMPAYNHEKFVGAAIESVLQQSCSDLELIIIDDGSTDSTGEIARSYTDSRVRYYFQDNQDAFNALNRGIKLSQGEFISIINSDDLYVVNRLERLLEIQRSTAARCIFSDVIPIDDDGNELNDPDHLWLVWHHRNKRYFQDTMDLYDGFLHGNFMVTTSNLFLSKELTEVVGGFAPIRYLHDYDYIFRVLLAAEDQTVYLHDEKLLYYRIHAGNTLSEAAVTGREQDRILIRKYLLQRTPPELRRHTNTAIDRLIALEHELLQVHAQLDAIAKMQNAPTPSIPRRVLRKLRSLTSTDRAG